MKPILERLPVGGRLAVIRLRSLGDCILTTPALQILKDARPDLRIGVVVEQRFAAVFEDSPYVDRILAPSASALALWRPHVVLNFHGGTRSIALTLASLAGYRGGFDHFRAGWAYNVHLPRAQQVLGVDRKVHTAEHLASAMFYLGAAPREIPAGSLFATPWPRKRPYALIHPFASAPSKAWPMERFVALAEQIRDHSELDPVILCGPADDASQFAEFEIQKAPLALVKSIVASASLFIGNDSGPAHMASAFGIPAVVLFGASDPAIWGPWRNSRAETLVSADISRIALSHVAAAVDRLKVLA